MERSCEPAMEEKPGSWFDRSFRHLFMVLPSIVALRGRSELAVWSSCRATAAKRKQHKSGTGSHLSAVCFVDEKRGWAAGVEGTIISTVDGGLTWKQQSGIEKHLLAIAFANDSQGVAAGAEGTLIVTSDGGSTWQLAQQKPVETKELSYSLLAASARAPSSFWVAGSSGRIFHSSDGGKSWSEQR